MPDDGVKKLDEAQERILRTFEKYKKELRGDDPAAKDARLLPFDPFDPDRYLLAELPKPAPTGLPDDVAGSAVTGRRSVEKPGDSPPAPPGDSPPAPPGEQQAQSGERTGWRQTLARWIS
jgi:hypothetical protein